MLDPTWAGLLVVAEVGLLKQSTHCLRARGRYAKRKDEIDKSIEDGYSNTLTPALAKVIRGVIELRGGGGEVDGDAVPLQPIDDVLASGDLYRECEDLQGALEDAVGARQEERRSIWIQGLEAVALIVVMLILPITVWPALGDEYLVDGPPLHVLNTLLGIAATVAAGLFLVSIRAENNLEAALTRHRGADARIGG